jgi:hypothetical protein
MALRQETRTSPSHHLPFLRHHHRKYHRHLHYQDRTEIPSNVSPTRIFLLRLNRHLVMDLLVDDWASR